MRKTIFAGILSVSALTFAGCGSDDAANTAGEDGNFEPSKTIEVVAPAGSGGG